MAFTGVRDTDILTLLNLDYSSLLSACRVNVYLNSICQDDYFWRLKVERDFGAEVLPYKPQDENYAQQYRYLLNMSRKPKIRLDLSLSKSWDDPRILAIGNERIDALIILERYGIHFGKDDANQVAAQGRLEVLEWLAQRGILPNQTGANWAAEYGHLPILEWLGQRDILPNESGAGFAAENGHLEVLEWLAQREILPDEEFASEILNQGRLNILEWMIDHGRTPGEYYLIEALIKGVEKGDLSFVERLLARGVLPDLREVDWSEFKVSFPVSRWLVDIGVPPESFAQPSPPPYPLSYPQLYPQPSPQLYPRLYPQLSPQLHPQLSPQLFSQPQSSPQPSPQLSPQSSPQLSPRR